MIRLFYEVLLAVLLSGVIMYPLYAIKKKCRAYIKKRSW